MPGGVGPNPLPVPGTREFTLSAVGPGWGVYFKQHPLSELDKGGICVDVDHHAKVDEETGELIESTRYRVFTWVVAEPFTWINADQVDPDRAAFERTAATKVLYRLLRMVVARRKDPSTLPASDAELLGYAIRLFRALTELGR
jgi:hypothetical protein